MQWNVYSSRWPEAVLSLELNGICLQSLVAESERFDSQLGDNRFVYQY